MMEDETVIECVLDIKYVNSRLVSEKLHSDVPAGT